MTWSNSSHFWMRSFGLNDLIWMIKLQVRQPFGALSFFHPYWLIAKTVKDCVVSWIAAYMSSVIQLYLSKVLLICTVLLHKRSLDTNFQLTLNTFYTTWPNHDNFWRLTVEAPDVRQGCWPVAKMNGKFPYPRWPSNVFKVLSFAARLFALSCFLF